MRVLAFDCQTPAHLSSGLWRHEKDQGYRYTDLSYWTDYAKLLEEARFDGIFFADAIGYHDIYEGNADAALADAAQTPSNDPLMVVSGMAAVTENLCFGVTGSTSYEHPYSLARRFSTLDHLTKGRVGWNVVTSYADSAARNLGTGTQIPHDERYDVAEEYLEVCYKLWEGSWEDDAVVRDRDAAMYVDPSRVHDINHTGKYFQIPGFHLCEPSPQRTPTIFLASGSSKGLRLAASSAEAVFVNATTIPALKRQVDSLRSMATEIGRNPDHIAVLQMINIVVAPTDEAAHAKMEEYTKLVSFRGAMARYSGWTGIDFSQFDPDVPFKHVKTNAGQTMVDLFSKMDPDKEWTPRDIADYIGVGGTGPTIVGSPTTVADELIRWKQESGIAGFNVAHSIQYQDVADFIELVVPELQRRGVMWDQYDGSTMREKLYGAGNKRVLDDHAGYRYRATADQSVS